MTKRYKLLKEIPGIKPGSIFRKLEKGDYDLVGGTLMDVYPRHWVENNPEWFEEVVEEVGSRKFDISNNYVYDPEKPQAVMTYCGYSEVPINVIRELEARCALTREDVEWLIDKTPINDETDNKLQAILDAMK